MGGSSSTLEQENERLRHSDTENRRRAAELEARVQQMQLAENRRILEETIKQREYEARKQRENDALRKQIEEEKETRRLELLPTPIEVKRIDNIFWNITSSNRIASHWKQEGYKKTSLCNFVNVHYYAEEVQTIIQLFKVGNNMHFIDKIERVENPLLLAAYLLKKKELEKFYDNIKEEILFHGTTEERAYNICKCNFDWQFYGINRRRPYGKGVSFTTSALFASHYSDNTAIKKIMLVTRVLVGNIYDKGVVDIVPSGYDTIALKDGKVIVKFEENEFYPAYVITYHRKVRGPQINK